MPKKILTIGCDIASDETHFEEFESKVSLLDWDIILFRPDIENFLYMSQGPYNGKTCLTDIGSFRLRESCEHWRREIRQAVDSGKTVIVFLAAVREVYVATGRKEYSGTGRNQRITNLVEIYSNYRALPMALNPVNATGSAMKLTSSGADALSLYWNLLSADSQYKVHLAKDSEGVVVTTKTGSVPVGIISRNENSTGACVLVPDIDFYKDEFFGNEDDEDDSDEMEWTDVATQFAGRFLAAIVSLDKSLHSSADATPQPDWVVSDQFSLSVEMELQSDLLKIEERIEAVQRQKEAILDLLKNAGKLRSLLYENGKPLEFAVLDALRLLGFNASQYKDSDSEFDVVFECVEGRFLGEVEGKDTKAINVEKLRQLGMNIVEDLQREDVESPAKGVLFGNGYRLTSPDERLVQFTDKCIKAAAASSTALIATDNLFKAVQYLKNQKDDDYASICRKTILLGNGLVTLPAPPNSHLKKNVKDQSNAIGGS